jgi:uncharacterized membrane protein YeaQ/YmgE (transglycosylase-associated protein family)
LLPFGLYRQATVFHIRPFLFEAREVLVAVKHRAPHASLRRIVGISFAASMFASLLGSLGNVADALVEAPHLSNFIAAPFYFVLVLIVGLIISIPFGFIIGVPALWALRSVIPKQPILMAVLLGLAGCLLGIPIEDYLNRNSIQRGDDVHLYMAWGALVGSSHALILVWDRNRKARRRALTEID